MSDFGDVKPVQEVDVSEKTREVSESTSETESEIQDQYNGYLKGDKAQTFEYKPMREKETDTAFYKQGKSSVDEYLDRQDKDTLIKTKERILAGDESVFYEMGYKEDSSDEGGPQKTLRMHNKSKHR